MCIALLTHDGGHPSIRLIDFHCTALVPLTMAAAARCSSMGRAGAKGHAQQLGSGLRVLWRRVAGVWAIQPASVWRRGALAGRLGAGAHRRRPLAWLGARF